MTPRRAKYYEKDSDRFTKDHNVYVIDFVASGDGGGAVAIIEYASGYVEAVSIKDIRFIRSSAFKARHGDGM